jgi:hypothetical protein
MRFVTAALYVLGLAVITKSLFSSTVNVDQVWSALATGSLFNAAWDGLGSAALSTYHWLEAHPYPAVIGGMVLYMFVLMSFSHYTSRGAQKLQEETLRKQYQVSVAAVQQQPEKGSRNHSRVMCRARNQMTVVDNPAGCLQEWIVLCKHLAAAHYGCAAAGGGGCSAASSVCPVLCLLRPLQVNSSWSDPQLKPNLTLLLLLLVVVMVPVATSIAGVSNFLALQAASCMAGSTP